MLKSIQNEHDVSAATVRYSRVGNITICRLSPPDRPSRGSPWFVSVEMPQMDVHLHACVTDGVFEPAAAEAGCDSPPAFLPARPITQVDLAALAERARHRVIR